MIEVFGALLNLATKASASHPPHPTSCYAFSKGGSGHVSFDKYSAVCSKEMTYIPVLDL
jgi:hypothetical protein